MTCDPWDLKEVTLQRLNQEAQQRRALWQREQKRRVMDKGAERHPWPLSRPCSDRAGCAGEEGGKWEDGEAGGRGGGRKGKAGGLGGRRTRRRAQLGGRTRRREDSDRSGEETNGQSDTHTQEKTRRRRREERETESERENRGKKGGGSSGQRDPRGGEQRQMEGGT